MASYGDDRDSQFSYGSGRRSYDEDRYGGRRFPGYRRRGHREGAPENDSWQRDQARPMPGGRGGPERYRSADRGFDAYGYESDRYYDERDYGGHPREESRSFLESARDYLTGRDPRTSRRGATRSHIRCRDIMTRDVTVANRETLLEEIARMMRDEDTGVIPVVEDGATGATAQSLEESNRMNTRIHGNGRLVGLITDRDIVVRALSEGRDARTTRAGEIMTSDVSTAHPNDRVVDALRKMGDKQVRRIPVVDTDGILRGIISMADIALETEEDRELANALEEISSGSSFWGRIFA